jgi:hypothetical protein
VNTLPTEAEITLRPTDDGWEITFNGEPLLTVEDREDAELVVVQLVNSGRLNLLAAQAIAKGAAARIRERRELVPAVRALADFLEAHPLLPASVLCFGTPLHGPDREVVLDQLRPMLAQLPTWEIGESFRGNSHVRFEFRVGADVTWGIDAPREAVCDPRIVDGKVQWRLLESLRPPEGGAS